MYALDFGYDKNYLSDFGFIICDFEFKTGFNISSAGANITFNKVMYQKGKRHGLVGTQYDECIQTKFGICKNPDVFEDLSISNDEYRDLMRWLNRHEYLPFHILYDYNYDRDVCFYEGSFNVSKVKVNEILYGLELTFESDKPFGYGEEQINKFEINNAKQVFKLIDRSDDVGFTYPTVTIVCNESGDLRLSNELTGIKTVIKNCLSGEIITLDCANEIITSSIGTHDICNDFNYEYFNIGNTFNNRENIISCSLICTLEIRYFPIIKDIP